MKQTILLFTALIGVLLFAFQEKKPTNEAVKKAYIHNLEILSKQCQELSSISEVETMKERYFALRKDFKMNEAFIAHLDQAFYLKHINGAPLPKLEKNVPDLVVLEPKGFQVIDETIAEISSENIGEIQNGLTALSVSFLQLSKQSHAIEFTNELILHAVQFQWIRNYTLSLTGFDTPGSLNGIEDTRNNISGLLELLSLSNLDSLNDLQDWLVKNEKYIQSHPSFDAFDRANYYKNYWQPTYEAITKLYKQNDCPTWNGSQTQPVEVNSTEEQLFATSFFNKQAFIDFSANEINPKTIQLGKELFEEKSLSKGNKLACASCHQAEKGFSDGEFKSYSGNDSTRLQRNSPGLVNAVYTKAYFYDLRAEHLSQQFEHVIFSDDEFNSSLLEILKQLDSSSYRDKFKDAFPAHANRPVNPYTFKVALSAYVASLTSYESKFDQYMRDEVESIDSSVILGYNLFTGKAACATCHFLPNFSGLVPPYYNDTESEVLGIPADKKYGQMDMDMGRYTVKKIKDRVYFHKNSFKTTTIRNIAQTAPYMHNGVFDDLDEVLEFYNNGGGLGHKLTVDNQTLAGDSLRLTENELGYLKLFMESLSEPTVR